MGILALTPLDLVLGYVARRRIDQSAGLLRGRGLATAAVVLGWIHVSIGAVFIGLPLVDYMFFRRG
jgi:hypothetical protein